MTIYPLFRSLLVAALVAITSGAAAQSERRFETEQISAEQWQTYFDEVRALPTAKTFDKLAPNQILVQPDPNTVFIFTAKTHPAYPAVVKREITVDAQGGVRIIRTSYFAGDRVAYEAWLREFDDLERRNREAVARRLKESKQ